MGRIIVSQNVTLDGVVEDPTGEEGFARGGWFGHLSGADRDAWAAAEYAEALGAEALLMGRRTYEYFVARGWPTREGSWADRLRELPKYVVSTTLREPTWSNTTIVAGDAVETASRLKHDLAGEIVVYASQGLVPALMRHRLVDEVRLAIHPFVLGAGRRLFDDSGDQSSLRLVDNRTLGEGVALMTYEVVQPA